MSHTHEAYWEINSTFFTFYDDGEKNVGGQITWVRVRKCFVSVYSLKMACVCVCLFVLFCHNDRPAWDTTGLCFMITSLHTLCLMSCHPLCWKAPMARWCEYINTHFRRGKKSPTKLRTNDSCWLVLGVQFSEEEKNYTLNT